MSRKKVNPETGEITPATAQQDADYWAQMRTNLSLLAKNKRICESVTENVRAELADILDSGILSYPQTLSQLGLEPGMSLEERKAEILGETEGYIHSEREKVFLKDMAYKAQVSRKATWSWRIGQEATEKQSQGWHPFFITLTIDPTEAHKAGTDAETIWKEGREFRKYIRRLVNVVCKEMGHPPAHKKPYRPESDYVTYAGVIEHGKSRQHHHGHFIVWLRRVPASWSNCPNAGIRNPQARIKNECLPLRTYWPWSLPGLSPALYFRSVGDIWETRYNFMLPIKDGKPMAVSTARIAGFYITKYLAKEHREWHHRMKATRNLGLETLRTVLSQAIPTITEALTWRAENAALNTSLMRTHMVPLGLLRSEAKRMHYYNRYVARQLDMTELLQSNLGVFTRMLSSVRSGARPDRMDSPAFYDWVQRHLHVQKGYCKKKLISAHAFIQLYYPYEKKQPPPTKIGGNEIGYP